jgi:hypothetical protein
MHGLIVAPLKHYLTLGIAGHYKTDFFLLYVGDEDTWYRIDNAAGELSLFSDLIPGKKPIKKLHEPFHLPTWRVHNHHYSARPELIRKPLHVFAKVVADFLLTFAQALVQSPKRRRYTKR